MHKFTCEYFDDKKKDFLKLSTRLKEQTKISMSCIAFE